MCVCHAETNKFAYLLTYSRQRWSCEYSDHLRVIMSVCQHDKTKTAESKITKLGAEIEHHDTSPVNEY